MTVEPARWYDITRSLTPEIGVWPDDTPFRLERVLDPEDGASVTVTTITVSAHTGTHVDAPSHFEPGAETIEQLPLAPYWGPAQVVTISKQKGPLHPEDFSGIDLGAAPRLLVHSSASRIEPEVFPAHIVHPSPGLVGRLAECGVMLYGTDAPSMDAISDRELPGHRALLRHGIAILEGLLLADVPDGIYELSALPMKIEGGDGSPVRAVLRTL